MATALALLGLLSLVPAPLDDPKRREPAADAPPLQVFAWSSQGGLRYTWVLPEGYDAQQPRHLTVILHGTGLDYRWGHWNNKPGIFRAGDVVVSVDGTSPGEGDTRLFLGEEADARAFRDLLQELRATFAVDRVYLYGHSQGGFFVVYYAGEFPDTVSGVVAHASGAWNWSKTPKALKEVAIAFMHGTADPVVPYRQSPGSRDHYAKLKFPLLHLRRLDRYTHWPNAVRATETLDWCQGMTSSTPEEALACAMRMLREKPPDEYQWQTLVDYSGARVVLERLTGKGPAPFEGVSPDLVSEAKQWIAAIEKAADEHVSAVKKELPKKGLVLEEGSWLGHLIPLREDFRGVPAVEALVEQLGYDKKQADHGRAADLIWRAWSESQAPEAVIEAVAEKLGQAFLTDGLPAELSDKMDSWLAQDLELSSQVRKKLADFECWQRGWKEGLEEYGKLWKDWKGPPAEKGR